MTSVSKGMETHCLDNLPHSFGLPRIALTNHTLSSSSSSPPLFLYVSSVNFLLVITSLTKRDQSINIAAPSPKTKMKWPLMWPFEAPFTSLQSKRLISRGQKCTRTEALSPIVVVTYPSKNIQFFSFTCKSGNKFLIT